MLDRKSAEEHSLRARARRSTACQGSAASREPVQHYMVFKSSLGERDEALKSYGVTPYQCALNRSRLHIFFYARTLPLLFRSCFRVHRDDFPGGGPRRCWSSRCSSPGCPSSIRACSTTSSHASAPPIASLSPVRPPPAISLHLTHLRALLLSCLPAASELPRCRFAETKHAPATPLADARARAGSGHHQQRRGGPEWAPARGALWGPRHAVGSGSSPDPAEPPRK